MTSEESNRRHGSGLTNPQPSIEALLRETPSTDMDLVQFLVIAGFAYEWEPLSRNENRELLSRVTEKYQARRAQLSPRVKGLETDVARRLRHYYEHSQEYGLRPIRTVRDLSDQIAAHGGRVQTPNLGEVTISYLNSTLRHYGVAEIGFVVPRRAESAVARLPPYQP